LAHMGPLVLVTKSFFFEFRCDGPKWFMRLVVCVLIDYVGGKECVRLPWEEGSRAAADESKGALEAGGQWVEKRLLWLGVEVVTGASCQRQTDSKHESSNTQHCMLSVQCFILSYTHNRAFSLLDFCID